MADKILALKEDIIGKKDDGENGGEIFNDYENNIASGYYAHAEGVNTCASGDYSHSEGESTSASGHYAHAEGVNTFSEGEGTHAEGKGAYAYGEAAHAEGINTYATGNYSHAEGEETSCGGDAAHSEGGYSIADGDYSHAGGFYSRATSYQYAIGRYNLETGSSNYNVTKAAFVIGNGEWGETEEPTRGNAFKVNFNGQTFADGAYSSTGADYAEYFEWVDGNKNTEDRIGYFVTLDGEKIKKATSRDDYILGVVSGTAGVIGDNYENSWNGRYITDEFGRIQYEDVNVTYPAKTKTIHHKATEEKEAYDETITLREEITVTEKHMKQNPDFDNTQEYMPRAQRKEWDAIGMMGKLFVRDDGTCQVNGYCKPNDDGIATASETGYRVIKRINENIIRIILK